MFFLSNTKYKILLIVIVSIFLSSCLTINSNLSINSNSSGTMNIVYSMSKTLKGISNLGNNTEIVPLNLSEEYIQGIIGNRTDIRYVKYRTSEDDKYFIVDITFEFDTIEALNIVLPAENAISLVKDGNDTLFSQGIITLSDDNINNETLELFRDLYKDNYFTMNVTVPRSIISVNQGFKEADRVAVFNEKVIDLLETNSEMSWSIRW